MYANAPAEAVPAAEQDATIIDRVEMERRIGGDGQLLRELVDIFERDCPPMLAEPRPLSRSMRRRACNGRRIH